VAFNDIDGMLHVFLPATAHKLPAELRIIAAFYPKLIALQITASWPIKNDPFGKLFAFVVRGQCGN
jgi:hypothetical protein